MPPPQREHLKSDAFQPHSLPGNENRYVIVRSHWNLDQNDINELSRGREVIYLVGKLQYEDDTGLHEYGQCSFFRFREGRVDTTDCQDHVGAAINPKPLRPE